MFITRSVSHGLVEGSTADGAAGCAPACRAIPPPATSRPAADTAAATMRMPQTLATGYAVTEGPRALVRLPPPSVLPPTTRPGPRGGRASSVTSTTG